MNPQHRPWTDAELALLGTDTDAAVAARIGRTLTAVLRRRRDLAISAYTTHARAWTAAELARLGTVADEQLAQELGCRRITVMRKRRALGIGCSAPANVPRKFRRRRRRSSLR
ncbi:MAG: hypothetical protein IPM64_17825 [Phycisphaerales bacterium]|nr:hypothetical protein [Phycisphaerales bacterium]